MTDTITAYKAFNSDWTCRAYQYEVGQTYIHGGEIEPCVSGFHACLSPMDCWSYYDITDSKFAAVEFAGDTQSHSKDSKVVGAQITVSRELSLPEFIEAGVDWLIDKTKRDAASGHSAQLAASGDLAQLAASGYSAKLAASGEKSVIASASRNSNAKGSDGTWISLAEYNGGECVGFATGRIGFGGLKADTYYRAKGGKLVEVKA